MNKLLKTLKKIESNKSYANFKFFDTGSYLLNALISADIYKGIRTGGITHLAAESSVGKTLLAEEAVKNFLDTFKEAYVYYIDTENAVTKEKLIEKGIDIERVILSHTNEIHTLKQDLVEVLNDIEDIETPQLMIVIDSLNAMVSKKEIDDIISRNDKKDMTKVQEMNSLIRNASYLCGQKNVPLITTGHVYEAIGSMSKEKAISGGNGIKYFPNMILQMTKSKLKDGVDVVGTYIRCKTFKGRLAKENQVAVIRNFYDKGLDRYYGLIELALLAGLLKKEGNRVLIKAIGENEEKKVFINAIYNTPEKYFSEELLNEINEYVKKNFAYGSCTKTIDTEYDLEEGVEEDDE